VSFEAGRKGLLPVLADKHAQPVETSNKHGAPNSKWKHREGTLSVEEKILDEKDNESTPLI